MNDKALLEQAARAVGLKYHAFTNDPFIGYGLNIGDLETPIWNPLTDDADALRLSVKLHISVFNNETTSWAAWGKNQIVQAEENHFGDDPYAATRRAITRAAAEIGKTK
jgi:hypothetical protein